MDAITRKAIDKHGAAAVYRAAVRHLEGATDAVADVELGAPDLGAAWQIMTAAYREMTPEQRANDHWQASKELRDKI